MLRGWARLRNGPLVPHDVTKVTPLGQSTWSPPRLASFVSPFETAGGFAFSLQKVHRHSWSFASFVSFVVYALAS
jgi:hypothetical protein